MGKILEKPWFKWAVIGGASSLMLGVLGIFLLKAYLRERELERQREARIRAEQEYEDKFRTAMTRIYQNLKLEHYLAAYKNLEYLPEPKKNDPSRVEEYLEVLSRIGNGLIQNQMLKESEGVFLILRNWEGQMSRANEALSRIESKRGIEHAKLFLSQGEHLIAQQRYREAYNEFGKAELELRSVEVLKFDNVKDLWARLMPQLLESRFYTLIADAEDLIRDAEKALNLKKYRETDQSLTQASVKVGKAAYLRREAPEVQRLRDRISSLDADLGYMLPNDVPIWNSVSKEEMNQAVNFVNLVGYELTSKLNEKGEIPIALQYLMHGQDSFFIVRYRVYFYNNRDIFNGHFLNNEKLLEADQVRSVVYLQEIPEDLRKVPIKRIEVKIFDVNQNIMARVSRAFRKPAA